MDILKQLNWRYATKKFDSAKKLSEVDLNEILESLRLAPSSFGLQPWKFVVVENKEIREKLKAVSWDQSQVTDASHLIVLCSIDKMDEAYVDKFIELTAASRNLKKEDLRGYKDIILGTVKMKSADEMSNWMSKQSYIALGMLLTVCAFKNIDSCPMEGFDKDKFDEILGLKEKGLCSVVICPIGYRAADDKYAANSKVRFTKDEMVEVI